MRNAIYVKNLTARPLSIGDLPFVPTIEPNKVEDLLQFYSKSEIYDSTNLVELVQSRRLDLTVIQDGVKSKKLPGTAKQSLSFAEEDEIELFGRPVGETGPIGETGPTGEIGSTGPTGSTGSTGSVLANTYFTSDYGDDIQTTIDAAPDGATVFLDSALYDVTEPILIRERSFLTIRGLADGYIGFGAASYPTTIIRPNSWNATYNNYPLIDMVGSTHCIFENFALYNASSSTNRPRVGVLLGRTGGASAGAHTFRNFGVSGRFTIASVCNIGSEVNYWERCSFWNVMADSLLGVDEYACCYLTSSWNLYGIEATGGVDGGTSINGGGAVSNVSQNFSNCSFHLAQPSVAYQKSSCIVIEPRTVDYYFTDCAFTAKIVDGYGDQRDVGSGTIFKIGHPDLVSNNIVRRIHINTAYCETSGARNFIRQIGSDLTQLSLTKSRLQSREHMVRVEDGNLYNCTISNCQLMAGFAEYNDATYWPAAGNRSQFYVDGSSDVHFSQLDFTDNGTYFEGDPNAPGSKELPNLCFEQDGATGTIEHCEFRIKDMADVSLQNSTENYAANWGYAPLDGS